MSIRSTVARLPQRLLLRTACYLVLAALVVMCASILVPKPVAVIAAMSVGHVLGALGVACFGLGVLVEMATRPGAPTSVRPPTVTSDPDEDHD